MKVVSTNGHVEAYIEVAGTYFRGVGDNIPEAIEDLDYILTFWFAKKYLGDIDNIRYRFREDAPRILLPETFCDGIKKAVDKRFKVYLNVYDPDTNACKDVEYDGFNLRNIMVYLDVEGRKVIHVRISREVKYDYKHELFEFTLSLDAININIKSLWLNMSVSDRELVGLYNKVLCKLVQRYNSTVKAANNTWKMIFSC